MTTKIEARARCVPERTTFDGSTDQTLRCHACRLSGTGTDQAATCAHATELLATFRDCWWLPPVAMGKIVRVGRPLPRSWETGEMSAARLRGREAESFGVRPAVMLGQDLAGLARLVRNGAVADLAAHDRKLRDGHREAAGA